MEKLRRTDHEALLRLFTSPAYAPWIAGGAIARHEHAPKALTRRLEIEGQDEHIIAILEAPLEGEIGDVM